MCGLNAISHGRRNVLRGNSTEAFLIGSMILAVLVVVVAVAGAVAVVVVVVMGGMNENCGKTTEMPWLSQFLLLSLKFSGRPHH